MCNAIEPRKVSQTVLEQATYYETNNSVIYNIFIDFNNLKFYKIDMEKIHHTEATPIFEFYLEGDNINIKCKDFDINGDKVKCNQIILNEHKSITFNYDSLIAQTGGAISYLLIIYGFFCLFRGYIYYNLTVAFYSTFSLILLGREFCELMEMKEFLNSDDDKSKDFLKSFYAISLISAIVYGYSSFLARYLRYISFGFIEGLIISKFLFYFIIQGLENEIVLKYFITELVFCSALIVCWFFLKNKYEIFTMINLSLMASYGIIYGLNVLFGGLPFMPFLILSKENEKNENIDEREKLFQRLITHNKLLVYSIFYVVFALAGSYFNITNTKIFMQKSRKKISVY